MVPQAARSDGVEGATLAAAEWARIVGRLKDEVGETAYRSWLQSMRLEGIEENEAVLAVPTRFLRNWIESHYADRLLALWRAENAAIRQLTIIVEPRVAALAQAEERQEPTDAQPSFAEPA